MGFLCNLFGHRIRRQVRAWYVSPRYHSIHVADEVVEERFSCPCRREDSGWKEIDRSGITSLSMSSERWALLGRDGKIPTWH